MDTRDGNKAPSKETTMDATAYAAAQEWIDTDPQSIDGDIARLGIDGAAVYEMDLISDCGSSGDDRWGAITLEAMAEALTERLVGRVREAAREVGQRVGRAMAADVLREDMPREWTGIDAQDGDQFTAAGIAVDTPEWEEALDAARVAYLAALAERREEVRP